MHVKRRQPEARSVVDRCNRERNKVMKCGAERRGLQPTLGRRDAEQTTRYVLQYLNGVHTLEPKGDDAVDCVQCAG